MFFGEGSIESRVKRGKERAFGKEVSLGLGLRLVRGHVSCPFFLTFFSWLFFVSCMCQLHLRAKEIHELCNLALVTSLMKIPLVYEHDSSLFL